MRHLRPRHRRGGPDRGHPGNRLLRLDPPLRRRDHAVPAFSRFRLGWNSILSFWFAYVVTRPLGASVADWLAVSHARGGLALGTGPVSLVLAAATSAVVYHLARTGRDTPADQLGGLQPPGPRQPDEPFLPTREAPEEA
ncbi:MAG: hypothetical protein U0R26_10395 [Solirubrobacterales bacterium]